MKVIFLTSGHDPFDDRIFYHMSASLIRFKHSVCIITSTENRNDLKDGIRLNCFDGINLSKRAKVIEFVNRLKEENAEIIVCSEPLPVYASFKYRNRWNQQVKIIYDITEWYPSKKNLCGYNELNKCINLIKLLLFNLLVSGFADAFIFGEWYKSRSYRFLFPLKPFIFIPYYPDLKYINHLAPGLKADKLRLSFSGKLTDDKGFGNFTRLVDALSDIYPDLNIEVKIIGWADDCEKNYSKTILPFKQNVSVSYFNKLSFTDYLSMIRDTDIFLDLRKNDLENSHSLPIKLFLYAAFGRPVIFSNLKAIRKVIDVNSFGYLVNPSDTKSILDIIHTYLTDESRYLFHCSCARKEIEEKYNWSTVESGFIEFILSVPE
jgi:glycosyltransferase involved in cell wall biosynthesis